MGERTATTEDDSFLGSDGRGQKKCFIARYEHAFYILCALLSMELDVYIYTKKKTSDLPSYRLAQTKIVMPHLTTLRAAEQLLKTKVIWYQRIQLMWLC